MPYKFVPAPPVVTKDGISLFHVYDDDMLDNPTSYWFTWVPDDESFAFDVRAWAAKRTSSDEDPKTLSDEDIQQALEEVLDHYLETGTKFMV